MVYLPTIKIRDNVKKIIAGLCTGVILLLIFFIDISGLVAVLIMVGATFMLLWTEVSLGDIGKCNEKVYRLITIPGRYSYDIYIWHQIIVAFCYYFVYHELNIFMVLLVCIATAVFSTFSINVSKKVSKAIRKNSRFVVISVLLIGSGVCSLLIYIKAGVVRDIPELGIDVDNAYRNMHAQYVDVPYSWDKDFEDESKIHVLVMGNSFGRDFANILNESSISDKIEVSYLFGNEASSELDRIEQAEFVFYGTNGWEIPNWIIENINSEKLYIVGNKSFGNSNGIIYVNKNKVDYFSQRVKLSEDFLLHNAECKALYGDNYIDMITPLLEGDRIQVFTDDSYFISQDGKHLTKYGAQYYARILDLSFISEIR